MTKTTRIVLLFFCSALLLVTTKTFALNDLEQFTYDMRTETRWSNAPGWAGGGSSSGYYTANQSPLYSLCDTCRPAAPLTFETIQCLNSASSSCGGCGGGYGGCRSE